ncbi:MULTISPECIES: sugar phosphate nucleotidyltransferase [Actinosynnema]|uniref:sugar phosphate nucleotidyltransferase n=1 Tax=Actinosynnema TaxID=40566 RepID=UPI0020A46560|nr:sugar phosphate nucleotidyltransferase [Actinosynnema pretiosum]MCP2099008.1 glucose-1-phosphate adenylyltransferase [Actinosynnema pretiosum]
MTADVRAALLAGGLGERMGRLTDHTCKPLVPYAASCRLVDFSVANAVRSGIPELVLMSLHRERDLIDHLRANWDGKNLKVHFGPHDPLIRSGHDGPLPERPPERGTADALLANAEHVFAPGARDVLVQHADHVYDLDYGPMIKAHRAADADVTIGVQRIERRYVSLFGMVEVDDALAVRKLVEKPENPTSDLIFTAFCLFKADVLERVLAELDAQPQDAWQHDISRDVLPHMIAQGHRVLAHPISCYWADIGTVARYREEHLKLLTSPSPLPLDALPTTLAGEPPRFDPLTGSLLPHRLPDGVDLRGVDLRDSVVFPGAVVEPGALVHGSVLLPGAVVPAGVEARDTVVDDHLAESREGVTALEPANR